MRLLIVTAISTLLLISGAFAQSNSPSDTPSERAKSETQELEKARSEAQRGNSDIKGDKQNAAQTEAVQAEHPGWYSENKPYRPCPTVAAINGRKICLGCPGRCPYPPLFQPGGSYLDSMEARRRYCVYLLYLPAVQPKNS